MQHVYLWNGTDYVGSTTTFARFCSGDLPATSALYNSATGAGTQQHIYLTGEESGTEGRATATIVDGTGAGNTYELPALGNLAYENVVANPTEQQKTIVAMDDDGQNGQVYIYVGEKQTTGSAIAQAGLSSGSFYGIKVAGVADEQNGAPANGTFTLQTINGGDVSGLTGAQIDAQSEAAGVTSFLRPEDFSWDPQDPSVAYFTTTNSFSGVSRIYQLTFTDISHPELGGTIQAVVQSSDYGAHMFDNLTVADGKVIVQEDPGNNAYVARVWEYDIATGGFHEVATFNPDQFNPATGTHFITQDEESSGVINITDLLGYAAGEAYLLDAQVHKATGDPATVERGQLVVMYVDDPFLVGGNGNGTLIGSYAGEELRGNNGNDVALAGSGDDLVYGGNGNDSVFGHAGNDQLFGERGNDVLVGGAGNDTMTGGQGDDRYVIVNSGESGNDVVTDFSKGDLLLLAVALDDADGDGLIPVGSSLALFGSSAVELNNGSSDVASLKSAGTVVIDGVTYYAYSATHSSSSGAASVHLDADLHSSTHHHVIESLI
jgi:Ca2+-binding RTX toxin-like protein